MDWNGKCFSIGTCLHAAFEGVQITLVYNPLLIYIRSTKSIRSNTPTDLATRFPSIRCSAHRNPKSATTKPRNRQGKSKERWNTGYDETYARDVA
jgi:hypothetical protein